jgi:hypothetical protein
MCLQARSRGSHPTADTDSPVRPVHPNERLQWDQLEASLKRLDASGYLGEVQQDLFSVLDSILSTKALNRLLLQYRGEQAQLLVNGLQWVSNPFPIKSSPKLISLEFISFHPSVDGDKKRKFMQALLHLSKLAKVIPRSFNLHGVEMGEDEVEVKYRTHIADIFQGSCGGRKVCLKRYRFYRQRRPNDLLEV